MARIGENIVTLRKRAGMSQSDLANKLFVTPQAISRWERGETEPDIDTIKKLTVIFDCSSEEVINGVKTPLNRKQETVFTKIYVISSLVMIVVSGLFSGLAFAIKSALPLFIAFVSCSFLFLAFILCCEIWKLKKQRALEKALKEEEQELKKGK